MTEQQIQKLHTAIEEDNYKNVLTALKEAHAENEPLHAAVQLKSLEAVQYLISKDSPVDVGNQQGETSLHCAVRYCSFEISKALINAGADVNRQDAWDETPLLYAAKLIGLPVGGSPMDAFDTFECMLKKDADVRFIPADRRLFIFKKAFEAGRDKLLAYLLVWGVEPAKQKIAEMKAPSPELRVLLDSFLAMLVDWMQKHLKIPELTREEGLSVLRDATVILGLIPEDALWDYVQKKYSDSFHKMNKSAREQEYNQIYAKVRGRVKDYSNSKHEKELAHKIYTETLDVMFERGRLPQELRDMIITKMVAPLLLQKWLDEKLPTLNNASFWVANRKSLQVLVDNRISWAERSVRELKKTIKVNRLACR